MKKLFFITLVFVLGAGLLFGSFFSTAQAKTFDLTFSIADSPNHPDIKKGYRVWADEIEKRTNGQVKITIHAGETLAKSSEQYDMILKGAIDITKVVATHYRGRFPLVDIFSLPFLIPFEAKDKSGRLVRDILFEKFIEPAYFKDMKVLFIGRYEPNVIHLVKDPIRKLEDMKGKVISVPGGKTNIEMIKMLGASPETVRTPDVYTALERGMVDGHVLPLSTQRSFKFYEVTKYITRANFGAALWVLVLRKETWDKMPPDVQKIIDELNPWGGELLAKVGEGNAASAAKLVQDKGLEIIDLSPQERARWAKATRGIEDDWAKSCDAKGLPGSEMLKLVRQILPD